LKKIFDELENKIKQNKDLIEELIKIDNKNCKMKFNLEELLNIIHLLKNEKPDIKKRKKINIEYNGNPYITLNLCILAILTQNIIIIDFKNFMIGINSLIIEMVNNVLKEYKMDKLIYLYSEIIHKENEIDKIICIDDINKYNRYLQEGNTKVKFYSLNYIDFYSDCNEYEEIEELIYKFAEENQVSIEVYSELDLDEAIQMIKNGLGKTVVVLTSNNKTKQIFNENIKNKKLYINQNPFKEKIRLINKDILL